MFFVLAISPDVYEATSPTGFAYHVLLRKAYSVVAFAFVGGAIALWTPARVRARAAIFGTAAYSALIELAQKAVGSPESWRWNLFDIACGAIGGGIAALIARIIARRSQKKVPSESASRL